MIATKPSTPAPSYSTDDCRTIEADSNWIAEHDAELNRRYAKKWIAVWKQAVIGVGAAAHEAAGQAEGVAPGCPYTLQAMLSSPDVFHASL